MDWNEVRKREKKKKKKEKKKSMSRLSLVKQSEMILPSVLSEASSLVAKRGREREKEREGGRKKREEPR